MKQEVFIKELRVAVFDREISVNYYLEGLVSDMHL